MGDFALAALSATAAQVVKMAVIKISQSGTKDELLNDAGINFTHIINKVRQLVGSNKGKNII
jgi:transketolase